MPRKTKPAPEEVGIVRYTLDRLFYGCEPATVKELKAVWKDGDQIGTDAVPEDALAVVTLMAAWGILTGMEVVDDYPALLQRCREGMAACTLHHPDLYFISCICILERRMEAPTISSFNQIGIPDMFIQLFGE